MITRNLRHFRVFLAVAELGSPTAAAKHCLISQPAITQALTKLEREAGGALFERKRRGFSLTARGAVLNTRLSGAIRRLDRSLSLISPRLTITATIAQLRALIAMSEAQNFTLAAHNMGLSQPTVYRAVIEIERDAAVPLFERTSFGMAATRTCRELTRAARLALAEFEQAETDLAEFDGQDAGRVVVGSLPLPLSVVLPDAIAEFRHLRPRTPVTIIDGLYDDMLRDLRRGEIDFMVGALRNPPPINDVVQELLFVDHMAILVRPGHPLCDRTDIEPDALLDWPWALPRPVTPARGQFEELFKSNGLPLPDSVVECGSILLMRELLSRSDMLGCISWRQAQAEIRNGLLVPLRTRFQLSGREIGLTYRRGWVPTKAQSLFLEKVRQAAE